MAINKPVFSYGTIKDPTISASNALGELSTSFLTQAENKRKNDLLLAQNKVANDRAERGLQLREEAAARDEAKAKASTEMAKLLSGPRQVAFTDGAITTAVGDNVDSLMGYTPVEKAELDKYEQEQLLSGKDRAIPDMSKFDQSLLNSAFKKQEDFGNRAIDSLGYESRPEQLTRVASELGKKGLQVPDSLMLSIGDARLAEDKVKSDKLASIDKSIATQQKANQDKLLSIAKASDSQRSSSTGKPSKQAESAVKGFGKISNIINSKFSDLTPEERTKASRNMSELYTRMISEDKIHPDVASQILENNVYKTDKWLKWLRADEVVFNDKSINDLKNKAMALQNKLGYSPYTRNGSGNKSGELEVLKNQYLAGMNQIDTLLGEKGLYSGSIEDQRVAKIRSDLGNNVPKGSSNKVFNYSASSGNSKYSGEGEEDDVFGDKLNYSGNSGADIGLIRTAEDGTQYKMIGTRNKSKAEATKDDMVDIKDMYKRGYLNDIVLVYDPEIGLTRQFGNLEAVPAHLKNNVVDPKEYLISKGGYKEEDIGEPGTYTADSSKYGEPIFSEDIDDELEDPSLLSKISKEDLDNDDTLHTVTIEGHGDYDLKSITPIADRIKAINSEHGSKWSTEKISKQAKAVNDYWDEVKTTIGLAYVDKSRVPGSELPESIKKLEKEYEAEFGIKASKDKQKLINDVMVNLDGLGPLAGAGNLITKAGNISKLNSVLRRGARSGIRAANKASKIVTPDVITTSVPKGMLSTKELEGLNLQLSRLTNKAGNALPGKVNEVRELKALLKKHNSVFKVN